MDRKENCWIHFIGRDDPAVHGVILRPATRAGRQGIEHNTKHRIQQ